MLPKKQKLSWKDINYMLKRWVRVYGKIFIFRVIPQYRNNNFHQWAFQIPVKLDKRAVMRNLLKRAWFRCVLHNKNKPNWLLSSSSKYYKIFASINKKNMLPVVQFIASHNKTDILSYRTSLVQKDLTLLSSQLTRWFKKTQKKAEKK